MLQRFVRHLSCCRLLVGVLLFLLCPMVMAAEAPGVPWPTGAGRFRVPVQVTNKKDVPSTHMVLAIRDLPFLTLMNEGKLQADGSDLRLFDERGAMQPIRAENLTSDNGDARLVFMLDRLEPKAKQQLWLYYGGVDQELPGNLLAATTPPQDGPDLTVTVGAEEARENVPPPDEKALAAWLGDHQGFPAVKATPAGFAAVQPGAELAPWTTTGTVMQASGGPQDSLAQTAGVGEMNYTAWVRYASGAPAAGTLTFSVEQDGTKLAAGQPIELAKEIGSGFRWVSLPFTARKGTVQLCVTSANSRAQVDAFVLTADAGYHPDFRDFQARVWVRWRIDQPADFAYWTKVVSTINPYTPTVKLIGSVGRYGLQPEVDGLPASADGDFSRPGQYSAWVALPASTAPQWYTSLAFTPKSGQVPPADLKVRVEFANRPAAGRVFHVLPAEPVDLNPVYHTAGFDMRMPVTLALDGLQQVESFREWALRRAKITEDLKLSPPPHLKRLIIGTWDMPTSSGEMLPERADIDLRSLEALGINALSMSGVSDRTMQELYPKRGIIDATWTLWAGMYYYTNEGYSGQYNFKPGETPQQRWERVFTDYYGKTIPAAQKNTPFLTGLAKHLNMGDEIGVATSVDEITKTPELLAYFHTWLQGQGLTPQDLGAATWEDVKPADDRKKLDAGDDFAYARLFYWTKRFLLHYTEIFYGTATRTVKKLVPNGMPVANYQAGPMQNGYIGNNNDMDRGQLDIFELGRNGAFGGVMMEDWVHGWDAGIGRECFAGDVMRGAGRKLKLPLVSYLVGGEAIRGEYIAYLMHGIKENQLYLYGPVTNIGPAWGEQKRAQAETADVSRLVKKFEDPIADGAVRPRKAALLVAITSDYMQKKGLYFTQERQATYIALKHSYVQVDVICEQDITEDNLLKNYRLLYVTDPQLRYATQQKIAEWVKNGGRLWACVGAANWDEFNLPCPVLNPVFGVAKREMVTGDGFATWQHAFYGWQPNKFAFKRNGTLKGVREFTGLDVPVWGARLDCTPTTARVLGTYEDGKPGILVNAYGKGQAVLVGALVGDAYMREHYPLDAKGGFSLIGTKDWSFDLGGAERRLLTLQVDAAGVQRPVVVSIPGIYTSIIDSPTGTVVFLNNATLAAADAIPDNALVPTVTVRVQDKGVKYVESARFGRLPYDGKNGVVTFTLKLPNVDVIYLRH